MTTQKFTHPGNILLAGFGAMLLMMSVLVYLSMKQKISMVSRNYYEQELLYQYQLNAMNNTNKYDSMFSVKTNGDNIILQLPKSLSAAMQEGAIYFYCSSDEKMDRKKVLKSNPEGIYTFNSAELPGKRYTLKVSLTANGIAYYKEMQLEL